MLRELALPCRETCRLTEYAHSISVYQIYANLFCILEYCDEIDKILNTKFIQKTPLLLGGVSISCHSFNDLGIIAIYR